MRNDVRGDAVGDSRAVLIDDTGDLKRGICTVGTQRRYTGTARRIENAQVVVYLADTAPVAAELIDREARRRGHPLIDQHRHNDPGLPFWVRR